MFYVAPLILVAVVGRFLPHPPNVACLGALGLFVGCYMTSKRAYLVPITVLVISDVIGYLLGVPGMGFYAPATMLGVYGGATSAVAVGRWIGRRRQASPTVELKFGISVFGGSLAASTIFFVISNLGMWFSGFYPMTAAGLLACFVAAIPFYGYTLAGDLAFSSMLFGGYEFARKPLARLARAA